MTAGLPPGLDPAQVVYGRERQLPLALRPWMPFVQTTPRRVDGTEVPLDPDEVFVVNAHYLVHRRELRGEHRELLGVHLSMRTVENDARHDWRELQRVKSELCGPEWEAMELYPAESRVVDTANQYHLFCFAPGSDGHEVIGSIGFQAGRVVLDQDDPKVDEWLASMGYAPVEGAVQRPI